MRVVAALLIVPALQAAYQQGHARHPFDLQKAFESASKSVVVVHSINLRGEEVALGSGIVVAPGEIVTNAHVVLEGTGAFLTKETNKWEVKQIFLDPKLDLALLKTDPLPLPPARMGISTQVKPGQRLFAIGNPQGLELSLSDGIVSAVRVSDGTTFIQTTAPISPGSSGGGIFNTDGELIGITTFMLRDSQNLNFAISADYIPPLQTTHTELKIAKGQKLIVPPDQFINLAVINRMSNGELRTLSDKGNPLAQWALGGRLEIGSDLIDGRQIQQSPDIYRATYWLTKAAEHGCNNAATMLVADYLDGYTRKKNLPEARRLAIQMIANIDANYNIETNEPYTQARIKSELAFASVSLSRVLQDVYMEDPTPDTAMEALVWTEINAEFAEESLAKEKPYDGSSLQALATAADKGTKAAIDMRDIMFEGESKMRGVAFVEAARDRAKALMRGYGVTN